MILINSKIVNCTIHSTFFIVSGIIDVPTVSNSGSVYDFERMKTQKRTGDKFHRTTVSFPNSFVVGVGFIAVQNLYANRTQYKSHHLKWFDAQMKMFLKYFWCCLFSELLILIIPPPPAKLADVRHDFNRINESSVSIGSLFHTQYSSTLTVLVRGGGDIRSWVFVSFHANANANANA